MRCAFPDGFEVFGRSVGVLRRFVKRPGIQDRDGIQAENELCTEDSVVRLCLLYIAYDAIRKATPEKASLQSDDTVGIREHYKDKSRKKKKK